MKPEDFVKKIRESILDENVGIYKDLFNSTSVDEASDEYWKEALRFYGKLNSEERETLFKIIRQVSVDTISNLFGVLDGVTCLDDQGEDFTLTIGDDGKGKINGDLQDIFLEIEEDQ